MKLKEIIPLSFIVLIVTLSFYSSSIIKKLEDYGIILPINFIINDVKLVTANKKPFPLNQLKDDEFLVYFGYTDCPNICPRVLTELLKVKSTNENLKLVFINIDEKEEARNRLGKYVSNFSNDIIALNSGESNIQEIVRAFNYGLPQKVDNHLSMVFYVTPRLRVIKAFNDFKASKFKDKVTYK